MEYKIYTEKYNELAFESDRAVLLISSSIIENLLKDLLNEFFNQKNRTIKIKNDDIYENNTPLSTFSSKIKIGYLCGLISHKIYFDLEQIRKLRNKAAHNIDKISFTEKSVKNIIDQLNCTKPFIEKKIFEKNDENKININFSDDNKLSAFLSMNNMVIYHKAIYILGFQVIFGYLEAMINNLKQKNTIIDNENNNLTSSSLETNNVSELILKIAGGKQ